jgi:hypothetical protein
MPSCFLAQEKLLIKSRGRNSWSYVGEEGFVGPIFVLSILFLMTIIVKLVGE